jgi:hypothetical protein
VVANKGRVVLPRVWPTRPRLRAVGPSTACSPS